MTAITINDLHADRTLERKAMSYIRGAGAPWVYGWIRPFVATQPNADPVFNFVQITNNNFYADQMINQFQVVEVNNSGANSNVNVNLSEAGANSRR